MRPGVFYYFSDTFLLRIGYLFVGQTILNPPGIFIVASSSGFPVALGP